MRMRLQIEICIALLTIAALASSYLTKQNAHKVNGRLENCLRLADSVGRTKVYSCKKTAELGATVSISFASSFTGCMEQMDRFISLNRDACHRKYQKP